MGWSWSLWLCNLLTADCLAVGVARALGIGADDVAFAEEHRLAPALCQGRVIVAAYVDNGSIIGPSPATVQSALSGFLDELRRRRLVYHEVTFLI